MPWNCLDKGLGDNVATALKTIGITPERVELWIDSPCNCRERQARLNQLGYWASRILKGKLELAAHYLNQIME